MTLESEPIRGKVARVLSAREVALNVGKKNGVEPGMLFDILSTTGYEVQDPDTGVVIGSIDRPKVRVKITKVQDELSVAATYVSKRVNIGGTAEIFGMSSLVATLRPPQWVDRVETLKTDQSNFEELDEKESYVTTGDPVVQVVVNDES